MEKGDWVVVWNHSNQLITFGSFIKHEGTDFRILDSVSGIEKKFVWPFAHLQGFASYPELESFLYSQGLGSVAEAAKAPFQTAAAPAPTQKQAFVVAVTGHRPNKLGGYDIPNPLYDLVVAGLVSAFEKFKPDYVITGMAIGVDQWAAEVCINMNIPFIAAIPFEGQENVWPPKSQAKYQLLLSKAAEKYVICQGGYEPKKMQARNEWMMLACHQVVAVWDGTPGGTQNCLGSATKLGKPVHYVPLPPPGMAVGEFFQTIQQASQSVQPKQQQAAPVPGVKRIVEI